MTQMMANTCYPTQASSSIWQSTGLQNRGLWVRFLPGLPISFAWRRLSGRRFDRKRSLMWLQKKSQSRGIQKFFRETIAELKKVSWPTRKEAISLTKVVLIVILVMGAFLGILDYLFSQLFGLILSA